MKIENQSNDFYSNLTSEMMECVCTVVGERQFLFIQSVASIELGYNLKLNSHHS